MIMACGTGKTLAALFINEKLAAERTLVLVPSLSLLAQTLREWTANTKIGIRLPSGVFRRDRRRTRCGRGEHQ